MDLEGDIWYLHGEGTKLAKIKQRDGQWVHARRRETYVDMANALLDNTPVPEYLTGREHELVMRWTLDNVIGQDSPVVMSSKLIEQIRTIGADDEAWTLLEES